MKLFKREHLFLSKRLDEVFWEDLAEEVAEDGENGGLEFGDVLGEEVEVEFAGFGSGAWAVWEEFWVNTRVGVVEEGARHKAGGMVGCDAIFHGGGDEFLCGGKEGVKEVGSESGVEDCAFFGEVGHFGVRRRGGGEGRNFLGKPSRGGGCHNEIGKKMSSLDVQSISVDGNAFLYVLSAFNVTCLELLAQISVDSQQQVQFDLEKLTMGAMRLTYVDGKGVPFYRNFYYECGVINMFGESREARAAAIIWDCYEKEWRGFDSALEQIVRKKLWESGVQMYGWTMERELIKVHFTRRRTKGVKGDEWRVDRVSAYLSREDCVEEEEEVE